MTDRRLSHGFVNHRVHVRKLFRLLRLRGRTFMMIEWTASNTISMDG